MFASLYLFSHSPYFQGWATAFGSAALVALVLTPFIWQCAKVYSLGSISRIVPIAMIIVAVLIQVMHSVDPSGMSTHPDEALHLSCYDYFLHAFWPPAASDPAIVPSLTSSVWGISYLNYYDVVYFLAAHTTQPFLSFLGAPLAGARTFQLFLWVSLAVFGIVRRHWGLALIPLLLTPQVWYVFSYFNGDALPLFLSIIAVALVSDTGNSLDNFMLEGGLPRRATIIFCACIGLLIVSKANYLPVVFGIFLYIAIKYLDLKWIELILAIVGAVFLGVGAFLVKLPSDVLHQEKLIFISLGAISFLLFILTTSLRIFSKARAQVVFFRRAFVLVALALLFASPRIVDDLVINGLPAAKSATILSMTEKYAQPAFRPSAISAGTSFEGLAFAQKGISLSRMIWGQYNWIGTSIKSFFGTYGYMTIWAPGPFYLVLAGLFSTLLAWVSILTLRSPKGGKIVFLVFGCVALITISSIFYSWIFGFQPQGRYLLPAIPLLSFIFVSMQRVEKEPLTKIFILIAFALSVYSYASVGIPGIAAHHLQ